MQEKKTVILGASPNQSRYAYAAAQMLHEQDIPFVPVGIKTGEVFGEKILDLKEKLSIDEVDTVTLYISAKNQPEWYDYILSLKPKRIIFNPGTQNPELSALAKENQIATVSACTLVMLSSGQY
ncbi:CoA-binding protein [Lunatibacter salilacus]|uniref:CoA-binding protein n=1 Tax=Lunatibacter salilacus TaxID=2483804 RepID=UPI00131D9CB9|nr:CoA-binding protein [Lunatibacter salilacus]